MGRPFNFSAWPTFQSQPVRSPGKLFDRTDNDPHSATPQGGPAPYGRVLVAGLSAAQGTQAGGPGSFDLADRYYGLVETVSLPDKDGDHLINAATGHTYATDELALPVDGDGLLIYRGIGVWTEHGSGLNKPLTQPFGLGDIEYQVETHGQVSLCQKGNIWAYCETDIDVGDELFFRTVVTSTADGVQLLGGFSNVGGVNFQPFPHGSVFRPGPAGGAFVLTLNTQK